MLAFLSIAVAAAATDALAAERRALIDRAERDVRADPRPDTLLMLAELWAEEGDRAQDAAEAGYVAAYDRCFDTPGCDVDALAPDYSAANRARAHAVTRYRQLLARFPDARYADQAAYGLGFAWRSLGEEALADAAFTWLVGAHPESPLATDAWILIGERAFEAWDSPNAVLAYTHAAADRGSPLHTWALHRLGWSYWRLGAYSEAIEAMKAVVGDTDGGVDLRDEALQDLARVFADAGEVDELGGGCRLGRREDVRVLLLRLADTYVEQGKWEQAVQAWRRVIAADPERTDTLAIQGRIVEQYLAAGKLDEAAAEVDRLGRMRARFPDAAADPHPYEHGLREVAFALHNRGRAEGRDAYVARALDLYDRHRAEFPDAEHAPEVAWARALALSDLGREAEAQEAFLLLVASDPKGRYARLAAEAAARRSGR